MTPPIARVGVVAKSHLRAATPHLVEIERWLEGRGIAVLFETATAVLMPASATRRVADKAALVTDPAVHDAVLTRTTNDARQSGLVRIAMTPSAITGATGNQEFFLHLRTAAG